jgi:hypothetical protein
MFFCVRPSLPPLNQFSGAGQEPENGFEHASSTVPREISRSKGRLNDKLDEGEQKI